MCERLGLFGACWVKVTVPGTAGAWPLLSAGARPQTGIGLRCYSWAIRGILRQTVWCVLMVPEICSKHFRLVIHRVDPAFPTSQMDCSSPSLAVVQGLAEGPQMPHCGDRQTLRKNRPHVPAHPGAGDMETRQLADDHWHKCRKLGAGPGPARAAPACLSLWALYLAVEVFWTGLRLRMLLYQTKGAFGCFCYC